MSNPLPFCTAISSEGIGVRGTHPNSKWRVVVPRCDMDKPHTGQIVRANIGRIVVASEKRERKRNAQAGRSQCSTPRA